MASTSNDQETRIAACEFLHATIIYMIGTSATSTESTNFSKIYKNLFPEVLKLASEADQISR
jgi:DNA-dependent protein kinase catalytic subunit